MKKQSEKNVNVLLVDKRSLFRVGLSKILEATSDIKVVGESDSYADMLHHIYDLKPDVVVLGQLSGEHEPVVASQQAITDGLPESTRFLILVDPQEAHALSLRNLPKHSTFVTSTGPYEFCGGIRILAAGYTFHVQKEQGVKETSAMYRSRQPTIEAITHREFDILGLLACGHTNYEMAIHLSLTESTVKSHVQSLLRKLQLPNRVSVVIYAYETGLIKIGEKPAKILHISEHTKSLRHQDSGRRRRAINSASTEEL
ncbi:MAG: response regulator transcription factor [Pseudonocardiaceae bacterium]